MNLKNKYEDVGSMFTEVFKPLQDSEDNLRIVDYSYYHSIGHYKTVLELNNIWDLNLNSKFCSLVRFFNYLNYKLSLNHAVDSKIESIANELIEIVISKTCSEHHYWSDGCLYIKNNYHHNNMRSGWVGSLPLLCMLHYSLFKKNYRFVNIVTKSLAASVKDLQSPHPELSLNLFKFYDNKIYISEYPESNRDSVVVNCHLYLLLLLNIVKTDLSFAWHPEFDKISTEFSSIQLYKYSLDTYNPISPAYFDLHSTYLQKLNEYGMKYNFIHTPKLIIKSLLLISKVLYRLIKGYK